MAEPIDPVVTNLLHCDWVKIYSAGNAPSGAKTLEVQLPSGSPSGSCSVSTTNGSGGNFLIVATTTLTTTQIGVNANQDLYMHFQSSASPPAGTVTGVKTNVK